ncbi:MAG: hypothetical protein IJC31_02520 [Spirochaetaceae bacterium]|nr:hypothetical protein [Spirochaetaceae bacterium]
MLWFAPALHWNAPPPARTPPDGELGLFYDYVRERTAQTPFTRELDKTISRMKQEKEERSMYLTYTSRMMECRRDGYEEGLFTGLSLEIVQQLEREVSPKP